MCLFYFKKIFVYSKNLGVEFETPFSPNNKKMIKLFVAKLNPETNSEDLKRLFSPFGRVTSAKIVMDAKSGNSKNYGFVEMSHDRAALQAIDELHHSIFMDYEIIVKRSEPKGDLLQEERQTNEYLYKPRRRSD